MAYDPIKQLQGVPQLPLLKPGQESWAVRVLRRVLSAHGVGDKAIADPVRTPEVSPVYDAALEQLVRDFQRQHGLVVDGIVGPKTWAALGSTAAAVPPAASKEAQLRQIIVRIATTLCDLGVAEHGGDNRGVVVEAMLKHAGGRPGQPWCCAFVDFVYEWACEVCGVKPQLDPGLSCSALVAHAKKKGMLLEDPRKAQPGDFLVLKGGPTGWKHVGIVMGVSVSESQLQTVEGNTNCGVIKTARPLGCGACIQLRL